MASFNPQNQLASYNTWNFCLIAILIIEIIITHIFTYDVSLYIVLVMMLMKILGNDYETRKKPFSNTYVITPEERSIK